MTDIQKIPRQRDSADMLAIEALGDENARLREALADITSDFVLLKLTCARLIRAASEARIENLRLRRRADVDGSLSTNDSEQREAAA